MATNAATNSATQNAQEFPFTLDFDKKKLTGRLLACQAEHQRLRSWLNHPLVLAQFQTQWTLAATEAIDKLSWGERPDTTHQRKQKIQEALSQEARLTDEMLAERFVQGLRKNNAPSRLMMLAGLTPVPVEQLPAKLQEFFYWKQGLSRQSLAPIYQVLITVYHLTFLQPLGLVQTAMNCVILHQELKALGFGPIADFMMEFYAAHEIIVADALASAHHARGKTFHHQPWFQLFFEAWEWALERFDREIQALCLDAFFHSQAQRLLADKTLNERQHHLLMQLHQDKTIRDKKTLSQSLWYRVLYRGLTKRTQERDLNELCLCGFIVMRGKQAFEMT